MPNEKIVPQRKQRDPRTERTVARLMDSVEKLVAEYSVGCITEYFASHTRLERALRRALAAERRRGT